MADEGRLGTDLLRCLPELVLAPAAQHDPSTGICHTVGDRQADTSPSARNQRQVAVQAESTGIAEETAPASSGITSAFRHISLLIGIRLVSLPAMNCSGRILH